MSFYCIGEQHIICLLQVIHLLKLPYKYTIDLKKIGLKFTPHGKFTGFGSFPFPVIH